MASHFSHYVSRYFSSFFDISLAILIFLSLFISFFHCFSLNYYTLAIDPNLSLDHFHLQTISSQLVTMTSPQQDLSFFKDGSLVPSTLIANPSSYLSIISHVQGTSPAWLLSSLIETSLQGTAMVNSDLPKVSNRAEVVFISFNHPKSFYVKNSKKNGLDLESLAFHYHDCFSDLFTKKLGNPSDAVSDVAAMFSSIGDEISKIETSKRIIFIDGPELLLAATSLSANQLLFHLMKLNSLARQMFVIVSQDQPMLDLDAKVPTEPSFKVADFLSKLYHRSSLNISLRPLITGRAKDITGCLVVAGGSVAYGAERVEEKEYIYHVSKEMSVRLFFR